MKASKPLSTPLTKNGISVEVQHLHKSFPGNPKPVLDDVSFTVQPAEIVVIMGPSGGGKSILLRHLIGLESPDSGDILLNNQPLLNSELLHKLQLAMVFQSGALLNSLTVEENVGLYLTEHRLKSPDEIHEIVQEKLKLLDLEGKGDLFPGDLSGGMKKRVAIARALVIEPQLLLYDEPTSELDPLMAQTIGQEILNLRDRTGVTSLVVSHDRELAFGIADRIGLLFHGKLIILDTPQVVSQSDDPEIKQFLQANHWDQTLS